MRWGSPLFRQTVSFSERQMAFLMKESERLGISVAEVLRRIIDHHLDALVRQ